MSQTDKPAVVFDFDGTLIDSYNLWFNLMRGILWRTQRFRVTKKIFADAFEINPWKFWIKNVGLKPLTLSKIFLRIKIMLSIHYPKAQLFNGIKPVLAALSKDNLLVIISSTPKKSVLAAIKKHNINSFISSVLGPESGLTKKSKFIRLKKKHKNIIFVTDSAGDIREAHTAKVTTFAVTWGWHSVKRLKKAKPDYVVNKPTQLLKLITPH